MTILNRLVFMIIRSEYMKDYKPTKLTTNEWLVYTYLKEQFLNEKLEERKIDALTLYL